MTTPEREANDARLRGHVAEINATLDRYSRTPHVLHVMPFTDAVQEVIASSPRVVVFDTPEMLRFAALRAMGSE